MQTFEAQFAALGRNFDLQFVAPPPLPLPPHPPPPPDAGIAVPADATSEWFLEHPAAPVFRFPQGYEGALIPWMDGAQYIGGEQAIAPSPWRETTPAGRTVFGRQASGSAVLLDGRERAGSPFYNPTSNRVRAVTVRGFEIANWTPHRWRPNAQTAYTTLWQQGVIDFQHQRVDDGVAEDCHIHGNGASGVRVGPRARVLRNLIHDNGHTGMGGAARDILVSGNETFANTQGHTSYGWEAGNKFAAGDGLIELNYAHDENGPGLWCDGVAEHDLISNVSRRNGGAGVFLELDYTEEIQKVHDNVLVGNATEHSGWAAMRAQLLIAAVRGVDARGNLIEFEQGHGVALVQQVRTMNSQHCYVDDITLVENEIRRLGGSGDHIHVADDTHRYETPERKLPEGWIVSFLRNWDNPDVTDEMKARLLLEPNVLVG